MYWYQLTGTVGSVEKPKTSNFSMLYIPESGSVFCHLCPPVCPACVPRLPPARGGILIQLKIQLYRVPAPCRIGGPLIHPLRRPDR